MFHFSSRFQYPGILTEALACQLLRQLGYQPHIIACHLHAVSIHPTPNGRPCEDERHICCLEELATLERDAFLMRVKTVFEAPGYSAPLLTLPFSSSLNVAL